MSFVRQHTLESAIEEIQLENEEQEAIEYAENIGPPSLNGNPYSGTIAASELMGSQFIDYSSAIGRGIVSGITNTVNTIIHPLDHVIYPIGNFLYDGQIIGAREMYNSNLPFILDPIGNGYEMMQAPITQDPLLVISAENRMQQREEHVMAIFNAYANGSGPQRAEIITSMLVGGVALGGIAATVTRAASNLWHYGRLQQPQLYGWGYQEIRRPASLLSNNYRMPEERIILHKVTNLGHRVITSRSQPIINQTIGSYPQSIEIISNTLYTSYAYAKNSLNAYQVLSPIFQNTSIFSNLNLNPALISVGGFNGLNNFSLARNQCLPPTSINLLTTVDDLFLFPQGERELEDAEWEDIIDIQSTDSSIESSRPITIREPQTSQFSSPLISNPVNTTLPIYTASYLGEQGWTSAPRTFDHIEQNIIQSASLSLSSNLGSSLSTIASSSIRPASSHTVGSLFARNSPETPSTFTQASQASNPQNLTVNSSSLGSGLASLSRALASSSSSSTSLIAQRLGLSSSSSSALVPHSEGRSYGDMLRDSLSAAERFESSLSSITPNFFYAGHDAFRVSAANLHCIFSSRAQSELYNEGGDYPFFGKEASQPSGDGSRHSNGDSASNDSCRDGSGNKEECSGDNCNKDNDCSNSNICHV